MKKMCIFALCMSIIYFTIVTILLATSEVEYIPDYYGSSTAVKVDEDIYIEYEDDINDRYDLVNSNIGFMSLKQCVKSNNYCDFLPPFDFLYYYNDEYDFNKSFVIINPNGSNDRIYVKEDFFMPSLKNNQVDMVCMSLDAEFEQNIKNKESIDIIIKCLKSDGKLELNQDIAEHIKKYSWDNHCFYLKYEGYPIVEEFHLEETEDGRYIVDQYTPEEYDTIYWEEEAHQ